LSVPDELLAVMARRFDRYHSNRMVHILTKNGSSTSCNLTELSASGGIVELNTDDKDFSHQNIIKLVTELGEVEIRPIRREDKRIAFQFSLSSDDDRSTLRRLFVDSLPHNIVPRKQEFYEQSIELYKNLGYGPKTPEFENSWLESNLQSWKIQDKILPGCSLLSFSSDRQSIASSGTLPMSRSVAYGHSFCMIKNLPAAIGLFEQMVTGLAWTELLSDIEYYGGSYAKHSGFTTRLHVISEEYPQPIGQIRVESVQFYPSPAVEDIETQSLYFSVPLDVATAVGNNAIPDPLRLLLEPHDILSEHHQKKIYSIVRKDNNRICAYAICQASPDLFTAVDLFNWSWVAVLEEHKDDFQSICVSVKKSRPFRGTVVVGIIQSGEESPPSASDGLPLKESFWLFTKKEDVGILFAAISRAIYTVVKKYGDSAAEELKNIC
jgi:hypothetical protein